MWLPPAGSCGDFSCHVQNSCSCIEKLSTFCNKAMAKQKFYFLRFDQKLICPRLVPNSYLSYILTGVLKKEHTFWVD